MAVILAGQPPIANDFELFGNEGRILVWIIVK